MANNNQPKTTPPLRDVEYLGDGVYVGHDGHHVVLTTGSIAHPDNVVYLDPNVLAQFAKWTQKQAGSHENPEERWWL